MSTDQSLDERMRSQFEGNFLDATDLAGHGEVTVEIETVAAPGDEKDAKGKTIDKCIVGFKGKKKRLVVNKTNAKILAMQLGPLASKWIGQKVRLTVRVLPEAFGQKNVPVIRVVPADESHMTFSMRKKYGQPLQ